MAPFIQAIFLSAFIFEILASSTLSSTGAFFEETTGNQDRGGISPIKEKFNKNFHHCSLDKGCTFVIKNIKEGSYQKISNESELPKAREGLLIWKKMIIHNEIAEQITTKQGSWESYFPLFFFTFYQLAPSVLAGFIGQQDMSGTCSF